MIEREIHLTVERDRLVPDTKYAGFAGEHLATSLQFSIPEDWALEESVQYYVAYETAGKKRYRTENLPWPVETRIPQAAAEEGALTVQLNAVKVLENDTQLVKSASCKLVIGPSVKGEYTEADNAMAGLLEGAVADFQQALEELNQIIFNPDELKQGPKGDPGEPGPQGPQGEKGDKGDKGDPGDIAGLAPVASSGSYTDLTDTPEIPQKASDIHAADSGDFANHAADTALHKTAQDVKSLEWAQKYKGYYTDSASLKAAHPSGESGDFAAVGGTHTFWFWDAALAVWVDAGGEGAVSSVNSKTGEVVLKAEDLAADPPAGESLWKDIQTYLNGLNTREKALEASRGQPAGLATLTLEGKLSQMPSASDVGAVPAAEKGQPNGLATLDAEGNLVQSHAAGFKLSVAQGDTGAGDPVNARSNLGMGDLLSESAYESVHASYGYLSSFSLWHEGMSTFEFLAAMPDYSYIKVIGNPDANFSDAPAEYCQYELFKGSANYKAGWAHMVSSVPANALFHYCAGAGTEGFWGKVTVTKV